MHLHIHVLHMYVYIYVYVYTYMYMFIDLSIQLTYTSIQHIHRCNCISLMEPLWKVHTSKSTTRAWIVAMIRAILGRRVFSPMPKHKPQLYKPKLEGPDQNIGPKMRQGVSYQQPPYIHLYHATKRTYLPSPNPNKNPSSYGHT